ncbi:MAG: hypothetical protein EON87_04405 [Brevundimonas sp.]|nr:MAG: hypothetical protein EON87_04405 [Brevundimonas sp.]
MAQHHNPHGFAPGDRAIDGIGEQVLILGIRKDRCWLLFNPDDEDGSYTADWRLGALEPVPEPVAERLAA